MIYFGIWLSGVASAAVAPIVTDLLSTRKENTPAVEVTATELRAGGLEIPYFYFPHPFDLAAVNGPLRREYLRQYEIEDLYARAERVFLDLGGIPVDGGNIVTVSNTQSQAIKVEGVRTRVTSRKVLKDGALVSDGGGGYELSVTFDLSRGAAEGIALCDALPGCAIATPDPFDAEQRRKGYFAAHSVDVAPNTSFSFYTQFHGDGSGHTIELVTWYLEVDVLALDTRGARQRQSLVVRDPKTNRDFKAAIANFVSPPCPLYSLDQDTATLVKAA